jgi:hypothetical protein
MGPVLRQVRQAEPGQSRVQSQREIGDDQLAFDSHFQFAPALLEFRGEEPAVGGQAQIDAVMVRKVLRPLRP